MPSLKAFLEPAPVRSAAPLPDDSIYRAFYFMRLVAGLIGLALPWLLLLGDRVFLDDSWKARGSLSAYYHSGMRDFFVAILAVVGFLLVSYRFMEISRDNLFSILAGVFAVGVALVPTGIPSDVESLPTPLQLEVGLDDSEKLHFIFAVGFVISLQVVCIEFARRARQEESRHIPQKWWAIFHLSMAVLLGIGAVSIFVLKWIGLWVDHRILIGESIVVTAFGLSWVAKSWNRDSLPKFFSPSDKAAADGNRSGADPHRSLS